MKALSRFQRYVLVPLVAVAGVGVALTFSDVIKPVQAAPPKKMATATAPAITISPAIPSDIPGGANSATLGTAAAFAWQEFIALNWPAVPQTGMPQTRGVASSQNFGTDAAAQPVVWETLRGKVETFPGVGFPPGYNSTSGIPNPDFGYDHLPVYTYGKRTTTPATPPGGNPPAGSVQNNPGGSPLPVPACNGQAPVTTPAFINLDETTQIGEDTMSAGVVPAAATSVNAQPQLIRFLAKGNRVFYDYVAKNQFWYQGKAFDTAQANFAVAAAANTYPPKQPIISLPTGTILVKAAWRVLAPGENPANFHMKTVRYYENGGTAKAPAPCYREQSWALIALHIIQKTPSQHSFIYATFEYAGNILTAAGQPVEDNNGNLNPNPPATTTSPENAYWDAGGVFYSPAFPKGTTTVKPPPGAQLPLNIGLPVVGPTAYCPVAAGTTPAQNARTYYINAQFSQGFGSLLPASGSPKLGFCVNKRYFSIPAAVVQANVAAHAALTAYGAPALWQNYKLVNVQFQPFNRTDIDTSGVNTNRLASIYYLSNSVVETDDTLQQFFGGLTFTGNKSGFEVNPNTGAPTSAIAYNNYSAGPNPNGFNRITMGGCMGCHGRAQRGGADFSFTLNGGPVAMPEFPDGLDAARIALLRKALVGKPLPVPK
jgi:hypothetical protein